MYATGFTLFYYDQRIRKEGFDIEWMMQAAGMTVPAPPVVVAAAQPGQVAEVEPAAPAATAESAASPDPQQPPDPSTPGTPNE
jgi:hypothetical protein